MNKHFLNILDILLLCYVAIVGFNLYIHQNEFIDFELAKWILFLLCYVIARRILHKQWCLVGIALIGVVEAGIAIGQKLHWINSVHHTFDMTGTFGNPGPLGGYWHYKIFCVNVNTGFKFESRIFYFIHLQNEEDYESKESSSA